MKKTISTQQQSFGNSPRKNKLVHGGQHRKKRSGRGSRPLSTKQSHHIVFKVQKENLVNKSFRHPKNFAFVQRLLNRYAKKFGIKVEQISYQHNHIHLLAKSSRRANFHNFFRVFSGQIAQNLKVTDTPKSKESIRGRAIRLWESRPFTRIVIGFKNLAVTKNYIQLNEKEVTGCISYRKQRLRGMLEKDWKILWS